METFTWIAIAFCVSQSAMFSGLNLAVFSVGRLRLEVEASKGNTRAQKILALREDSNFTLTTILWGNVGINVLLTLLSESVMAGVAAFLFSTVIITFLGEIVPQAYFSRHALKMGALLSPVLRLYQKILYPVAKPCAWMLDAWLGHEGITFFKEKEFREVIRRHIDSDEADISLVEGLGALNFLALDDLHMSQEGEPVSEASIIRLPSEDGIPVFPEYSQTTEDSFLRTLNKSGEKWLVIVDEGDAPLLVLDADGFLRGALLSDEKPSAFDYAHVPIVVTDGSVRLDDILQFLTVHPRSSEEDVIDKDVILLWGVERKIMTGADIFGRLMRGIASRI